MHARLTVEPPDSRRADAFRPRRRAESGDIGDCGVLGVGAPLRESRRRLRTLGGVCIVIVVQLVAHSFHNLRVHFYGDCEVFCCCWTVCVGKIVGVQSCWSSFSRPK